MFCVLKFKAFIQCPTYSVTIQYLNIDPFLTLWVLHELTHCVSQITRLHHKLSFSDRVTGNWYTASLSRLLVPMVFHNYVFVFAIILQVNVMFQNVAEQMQIFLN